MPTEPSRLRLAMTLLLLSVFPISLFWKASEMQAAEDVITRHGQPVDPPLFWAFCALLFTTGVWAAGKAMGNASHDRKGRTLVGIFIGAFFFGSAAAVAMIAVSQSQLIGGYQAQ